MIPISRLSLNGLYTIAIKGLIFQEGSVQMDQKEAERSVVESIESKQERKPYEPPKFFKNDPLDSVSYVYYYYTY